MRLLWYTMLGFFGMRLVQSSFVLQRNSNTTLVVVKKKNSSIGRATAPVFVLKRTKTTNEASETESTKSSTTDPKEKYEHVYTAAHLQPRYTGPTDAEMTQEQREIRDAIRISRPRTGLSGPFGPWLAVPAIGQPAQLLGQACRYGTSLSRAESELVILFTAAKTKSHAEFDIHVGEALAAGITYELIASIPRDDDFSPPAVETAVVVPHLSSNPRQQAIARFAAELLDTYTVSDETYRTTKEILNHEDAVLVEITSIVGYYTFVALTLNVFQIPSK